MPRNVPPDKRDKTKATEDQVIAAVHKWKGKVYLIAAELKVTGQTVKNYRERWPKVEEAFQEARGRLLDVAEGKLYEGIMAGEAWAICFFLKCQGKARGYVERAEVRHGDDPKAPPVLAGGNAAKQPGALAAALKRLPPEVARQVLDAAKAERDERAAKELHNGATAADA